MVRSINRQFSRSSEVWLNLSRTMDPLEIDYFESLIISGENPIFLKHQVKIHDNMIRVCPVPKYPLFILELEELLNKAIHFVDRLKWIDRAEAELNNPTIEESISEFAQLTSLPIE